MSVNPYPNPERSETSAESILEYVESCYNNIVSEQETWDSPEYIDSPILAGLLGERKALGFVIHEIRSRIARENKRKQEAFELPIKRQIVSNKKEG
jgi:hypothetical protein